MCIYKHIYTYNICVYVCIYNMDPGKGAAGGAPAGAKKKGPATVLTKAQEKEHMARYSVLNSVLN
jgi:hypothetical protein